MDRGKTKAGQRQDKDKIKTGQDKTTQFSYSIPYYSIPTCTVLQTTQRYTIHGKIIQDRQMR